MGAGKLKFRSNSEEKLLGPKNHTRACCMGIQFSVFICKPAL